MDEFYGQDNLPLELPKSTSLDESYGKLPKSTALDEFYGQDSLPFELPKSTSLGEFYGQLPKKKLKIDFMGKMICHWNYSKVQL